MITLYYHRGACSTANHFALEEAGVDYEAIEVDLKAQDDPLAIKVRALNPMAMTPVIVLDDGTVLTQNTATLPFIADLAPEKNLFPARGSAERNQAERWLGFVASDLHPRMVEVYWVWAEAEEAARTRLRKYYEDRVALPLKILEDHLAEKDFILGDRYSVIDGYAVVALGWSVPCQVSLDPYPNIRAFIERVEARSVIRHVRRIEGPLDWEADKARGNI
jgi:glutathione S-transferase